MATTHAVTYTNIAIPAYEVGTIAIDMVMRLLESPATTTETRLLEPVLTVRTSTTAPRQRNGDGLGRRPPAR